MTDTQVLSTFDTLQATKPRECDPSFTLERHIASLRRDKTPEEVAALYAEWERTS